MFNSSKCSSCDKVLPTQHVKNLVPFPPQQFIVKKDILLRDQFVVSPIIKQVQQESIMNNLLKLRYQNDYLHKDIGMKSILYSDKKKSIVSRSNSSILLRGDRLFQQRIWLHRKIRRLCGTIQRSRGNGFRRKKTSFGFMQFSANQ